MRNIFFILSSTIFIVVIYSSCGVCLNTKNKREPYIINKGRIFLNPIKCSKLLDYTSYYWKIDSLANNGYRREARKYFVNCIIDSVSYNDILTKLGKTEWGEEDTLILSYYYYNTLKMGKEFEDYAVSDKIFFIFNPQTKYLSEITFSK